MRRIFITINIIILLSCIANASHASALSSTPDVIITELQTSSSVSAGEEFIELYNNTDHDIDFADTAHQGKDIWKIQFFSSTKVVIPAFNWDPKSAGLITVALEAMVHPRSFRHMVTF